MRFAITWAKRSFWGAVINAAKEKIEAALTARRDALADAQMQARLNAEAIDVLAEAGYK